MHMAKLEKVHGPITAHQHEVSSKEGWKKIPFLDENIPFLEDAKGWGHQ